jgi:heme A synthase
MQADYSTASSSGYHFAQGTTVTLKRHRYAFYAWAVVAYNLAVVVWGAYVRASGSGAGCGSHWPLCNGEVVPRSPQLATLIELTHRLSSGLALVLVVALTIFAFHLFPRKHPVRFGAALSLMFILTEALIGAGLVLFELVAHDASLARALSLSIHLVNTFVLLAVLTLTAWWAAGGEAISLKPHKRLTLIFVGGLISTLVLGVSGAVAALGDTLFPASSLLEGLRQDYSTSAHLFVRLRVWHPVIAIVVGLYLTFAVAARFIFSAQNLVAKRFALLLITIVVVQLACGAINVALLAPVWLQLVHLFLADLMWLTLVLLAASTLNVGSSKSSGNDLRC